MAQWLCTSTAFWPGLLAPMNYGFQFLVSSPPEDLETSSGLHRYSTYMYKPTKRYPLKHIIKIKFLDTVTIPLYQK